MRNICTDFTNTHSAGSEQAFVQLAECLNQFVYFWHMSAFPPSPTFLKKKKERQQNIQFKANSGKFLQGRTNAFDSGLI